MCNLANEKSGVLHLGNTQMHINKYTIVHIDKYTPMQLTNAQLRTTLTNKKLPSNFSNRIVFAFPKLLNVAQSNKMSLESLEPLSS